MPRNKTLPALGDKSPDSTLIKVVLPAPLGPMTACSAPTLTSRDTSSTAASPPKFLDSPRTWRIGSIIRLFRVFCEEVFTTEAPSSQRSENFLIKNSLLRVLRAFAVQSPSPTSQECLKSQSFKILARGI